MKKVVVVDSSDSPVGLKQYSELSYEDIYRVSALWLIDSTTGDVLMTQRKWTKKNDPGKWMAAVSGTIEEDETYDQNIVHEIEEEIGLRNLDFKKGPKQFVDDGSHKFFVQWYVSEVNKDEVAIKIQDDEVEKYAWMSKESLIDDLKNNPDKFVSSQSASMEALGIK